MRAKAGVIMPRAHRDAIWMWYALYKKGILLLCNQQPSYFQECCFLSDAMSVLQAIEIHKDKEPNSLFSSLDLLCKTHTVCLQWIPSHCDVSGNEAADALAKEGSAHEQEDKSIGYQEAKTIIKAKQHDRWMQQHPRYNKQDAYHQLSRTDQILIIRLRTGHNRLNHNYVHQVQDLNIAHVRQAVWQRNICCRSAPCTTSWGQIFGRNQRHWRKNGMGVWRICNAMGVDPGGGGGGISPNILGGGMACIIIPPIFHDIMSYYTDKISEVPTK